MNTNNTKEEKITTNSTNGANSTNILYNSFFIRVIRLIGDIRGKRFIQKSIKLVKGG